MQSQSFSLHALYEALDAQRQSRGLSWAQATREMLGGSGNSVSRGHALSVSTVMATRTNRVSEADGVLAMLRWLKRTPESFVPGHTESGNAQDRLPEIPPNKILRFDTQKLHAALDTLRIKKGMTWPQVAKEIGVSAASLRHLSKGGRTGFPHVMRIVKWLARRAADFMCASDR